MVQIKGKEYGASIDVSEMESLSKGEIIVGDGTGAPSKLTVGSNDQVLTADSAETTGVKWATSSAGGNFTLVSTDTLASDGTSLGSFTSLDINTDGYYVVHFKAKKDAGAGGNSIALEINADTTAGNYTIDFEEHNGGTVTDNRVSSNRVVDNIGASEELEGWIKVTRTITGYAYCTCIINSENPTSVIRTTTTVTTDSTVTNVTGINLKISGNNFLTGSTASLYKVTTA